MSAGDVALRPVHLASGARRAGGWLLDLCRSHPELITALLCAVVIGVGQRGPDLAAQAYRAALVRDHGFVVFDTHWYAGHPVPGYSLLTPPLAALIGVQLLGALSCVAATALFARLLRGRGGSGHDVAVVWFAVVSVVDLVVGRLPFAVGLAFALGVLVAVRERRPALALLLAIGTGCASPLAAAFLLLAAAAWWPSIGWRRSLPFAGAGVGIAAAARFGEGGSFPFPWVTLLAVVLFVVGGLAVIPRSSAAVRRGLVLYGISAVALFVVANPIGGNMVRLGAVVSGPVLAAELWRAGRRRLLALVALPLLVWQFAPLPVSFAAGTQPSDDASYYSGLLGYLRQHDAASTRLEVPLTDGRWETRYLAPDISLARGWERQVDVEHNKVLYDDELSAPAYHQWLLDNGVGWVALPDAALDESETGEGRLLTGPAMSFLEPVWNDAHWQLWRVRDPRPLVSGPAEVTHLDVTTVGLDATAAGSMTVLVHWTGFWRITNGAGCVRPADDGWTQVTVAQPGPVELSARFGVGALFGAGRSGSCTPGLHLTAAGPGGTEHPLRP